jgi:hypothetical protein
MALLNLKQEKMIEEALSDEALALIDHIGKILAEEYVRLLKLESQENESEEK